MTSFSHYPAIHKRQNEHGEKTQEAEGAVILKTMPSLKSSLSFHILEIIQEKNVHIYVEFSSLY